MVMDSGVYGVCKPLLNVNDRGTVKCEINAKMIHYATGTLKCNGWL